MKIRVEDLMSQNVIKVTPHEAVGEVANRLHSKGVKTAPVVDSDDHVIGIVSLSDLLSASSERTPVSHVMTKRVYKIQQYEGAEVAARMMRKHKIHHLIVTSERRIIGIISSFDLLRLLDSHKFVASNLGTPRKEKNSSKNVALTF